MIWPNIMVKLDVRNCNREFLHSYFGLKGLALQSHEIMN